MWGIGTYLSSFDPPNILPQGTCYADFTLGVLGNGNRILQKIVEASDICCYRSISLGSSRASHDSILHNATEHALILHQAVSIVQWKLKERMRIVERKMWGICGTHRQLFRLAF
jgi:hypothetical protein